MNTREALARLQEAHNDALKLRIVEASDETCDRTSEALTSAWADVQEADWSDQEAQAEPDELETEDADQ